MKNKIFGGLIILAAVGTLFNSPLSGFANNYKDTAYVTNFIADGSDAYTPIRGKNDTSASYIKPNSGNYVTEVHVRGMKGFNDSSWGEFCSLGPLVLAQRGVGTYLWNEAYQRGFRHVKLAISPANKPQDWSHYTLRGVWSPDNYRGIIK